MLSTARSRGVPAVAAACVVAAAAHAALPCDADLDHNGAVDTVDLFALLALWGTDPGGPPDFNDNGVVDTTDFFSLLAAWGPVPFDYGPPLGNPEAEQIALEMLGAAGPLVVPPDLFGRVKTDLALIRQAYPDLAGALDTPAWIAVDLIVQLDPGATGDEYECLNEQYQVTNIDHLFADWYVLTFVDDLNVPAVAAIYAAAPSVLIAEPNFIVGGENFWMPTDLGGGVWQWQVDDGFLDCTDGCDCHRFYVLETDAGGTVQLISYQEFGQPWCDFE